MERRTVLRLGALGVASVAAGCSRGLEESAPAPRAPTGGSATTSPATTASPSPSILPSRAEIVARYADRRPASFGLDVPGITQSHPGDGVALTFDLCGGPNGSGFDEAVLEALRENQIAATFFFNTRWVHANPDLAQELADDPLIEVASHGQRHLPLTVAASRAYGIPGTADAGEAYDEVAKPIAVLAELTGVAPRWFRAGTAHCDDVGVAIAKDLGQQVVNFTVNGDAGATSTAQQVSANLRQAGDGDIVIAHANQPDSGTAAGLRDALLVALAEGTSFVQLGDVLAA